MKFGVVIFPGSNCDYDTYYFLKFVLGVETIFLFHKENSLQGADVIILPGGFSYGDYLRTGAIAKFSPIMKEVINFANKGGLVIGICNGFQILCESGLLPGALTKNNTLKFVCYSQNLKVVNNKTFFTNNYQMNEVISMPIAHGEGNYIIDNDGLKDLYDNDQIILKYCDEFGNITQESNPNGSIDNIAGICNKNGNVFGLMPHPERCGEPIFGNTDGIKIFESILNKWKGIKMFGNIGTGEIILILLVVLILFGAKKIPELAQGLGKGIREFKKAMRDVEEEIKQEPDKIESKKDEAEKK